MEKILKKYTTIPQSLYINRSADEQLKNIIDEMERPGYVLVARQMGKTNLLFNAKRTLENKNKIFIYVDLSNTFEHERDCYRNIIDCITEPNLSIFESIEEEILKIREHNFPPHQEYTRSLRKILKFYEGGMVIILDEIDALRNAEYSDNIFAQIRSNYFSRTNFPEFNRLTYILSGVIEPTELIRDRNKSPFNIGEKIYLNDFTEEEHFLFIEKSKLNIKKDTIDQIYTWTSGNPRLTFDICSEIESIAINTPLITPTNIDNIVEKKYLTNFDIPPIDHIRELVKSNREVRSAIFNIQSRSSDNISDEIKNKLYLYGIINSDFNIATKIKNPIIESSLSLSWIQSIDESFEGGLFYALELFNSNKYEQSINSFLTYLNNSNPKEIELETANYHIGLSYYKINNIEKSIEYFTKEYENSLYKRSSLCFLGLCYVKSGNKSAGMELLEEIIDDETNDFPYHNALLNIAMKIDNKERSIELYEKLYESTFKSENDSGEADLNQFRCSALYLKGMILLEENKNLEAESTFTSALKYATLPEKLAINHAQYFIHKDDTIKTNIVNDIISKNLKITNENSPLEFNQKSLFTFLEFVYDEENTNNFNNLSNYALSEIYQNKLSKTTLEFSAYKSKKTKKNGNLLNHILKNDDNLNHDESLNIHREILTTHSYNSFIFEENFDNFKNKVIANDFIDNADLNILFSVFNKYISNKNYDLLINLCETLENRKEKFNQKDLDTILIVIFYWKLKALFKIENYSEAFIYSEKALNMFYKKNIENNFLINSKNLDDIKNDIVKDLLRHKKPLNKNKYGRNSVLRVIYFDGKIVEGKYKKIFSDINNNQCIVISDLGSKSQRVR